MVIAHELRHWHDLYIYLQFSTNTYIPYPPPSSPNFTPDALPAATLPIFPGLGQAPNMLDCIPGGLYVVNGRQKSAKLTLNNNTKNLKLKPNEQSTGLAAHFCATCISQSHHTLVCNQTNEVNWWQVDSEFDSCSKDTGSNPVESSHYVTTVGKLFTPTVCSGADAGSTS